LEEAVRDEIVIKEAAAAAVRDIARCEKDTDGGDVCRHEELLVCELPRRGRDKSITTTGSGT
jgi:hypothetical protein